MSGPTERTPDDAPVGILVTAEYLRHLARELREVAAYVHFIGDHAATERTVRSAAIALRRLAIEEDALIGLEPGDSHPDTRECFGVIDGDRA